MRPFQTRAGCGLVIVALITLSGCAGGQRLLKEPVPVIHEAPLATGQDQNLAVSLDWVIVPGGPGSWAANARWDQYQLIMQRLVASPITVTGVSIVDSMDAAQTPLGDRKMLVAATKAIDKRYEKAGFDIQPGVGIDTMLSIGTGAAAVGAVSGAALGGMVASLGAGSSAIAVGAAGGAFVLGAPILAVGGIVRASRHEAVSEEISVRASSLPVEIPQDEAIRLDLFLPVTPGPQTLAVEYQLNNESSTLTLALDDVLGRLHLSVEDAADISTAE